MVINAEDGSYYVHQGLVTLLAYKALQSISVNAYMWDWLDNQLQDNILSSSCRDERGEPLHSLLFLHWTTDEPMKPTLDSVYRAARLLKNIHPSTFRIYPSESEASQERGKLGDIRALNHVAQSSREQYSYRPKTCFGHGPCELSGQQETVHKRSHSGCGVHVHLRKRGERHQLTCTLETSASDLPSQRGNSKKGRPAKTSKPPKQLAHSPASEASAHWFHQEFVPALHNYEFRVFIATEPDEQGTRGRAGRVFTIAKTAINHETQALAARAMVPEDLEPSLTESLLVDFSLFVFESLRARTDSMVFFESLEVGVRLDIGVADNYWGEPSFFVNEITRWYGAHYFSNNICPEPKTQICTAFARAFSAFLDSGIGGGFQ